MKAKIEIEMDNAAFENAGHAHELGRILGKLADSLRDPWNQSALEGATLRDINGNKVGMFEVLS